MEVFSGTGTEEITVPETDWIGCAKGNVAADLVLCDGQHSK